MSSVETVGKVVAQFDRMVRGDGGSLALLSIEGDTARIRYVHGENACETCVLSEADLAAMILEAAKPRAPGLERVEFAA